MNFEILIESFLLIPLTNFDKLEYGKQIQAGIEKIFSYKNPDYLENEKWGRSNYATPQFVMSWGYTEDGTYLYVYRGGKRKLEEYLKNFSEIKRVVYRDNTYTSPKIDNMFPNSKVVLKPAQEEGFDALTIYSELAGQEMPTQGIALASTSFGKTILGIELARRLGQVTTVVVHTTFLQKQWIMRLTDPLLFGMNKKDIGGCGGIFLGKKQAVKNINICLYHSLTGETLDKFREVTGLLLFDEAQISPIGAVQNSVTAFNAKYRYGFSAGIERKDGKEFLILDTFGDVLFSFNETESDTKILCDIVIHPTGFKYPEYANGNETYSELITAMARDRDRNILIAKRIITKIKEGRTVILFVERKEQAAYLHIMLSKFRGALLLGPTGKEQIEKMEVPQIVKNVLLNYDDKGAFDKVNELGNNKELDYVIGSSKAEVGLSVNTFDYGFIVNPMSDVKNRVNQVKGRIERKHNKEQTLKFGEKRKPVLEVFRDDTKPSIKGADTIAEYYGRQVVKKLSTNKSNVLVRRREK